MVGRNPTSGGCTGTSQAVGTRCVADRYPITAALDVDSSLRRAGGTHMTDRQSDLDFSGQVAVVTGGGGGLGSSFCRELARRGAAVVVNDLGGSTTGEGMSTDYADRVVQAGSPRRRAPPPHHHTPPPPGRRGP